MQDIYRVVGEHVRTRRKALGWTQEELGEAAGLHPSFIGLIERGVKKASLRTLASLAKALGTTAGDLIDQGAPEESQSWKIRIDSLLRDKSPRERELLYSTLKHLSRGLARK